MNDEPAPATDWSQYPSAHLAAEASAESCRQGIQLVQAANALLQHLQTVSSALLFAMPAFLRAVFPSLDLMQFPFFLVIGFAFAAMVVATVARLHGAYKLNDPEVFRSRWLHKEPAQFEADLVSFNAKTFAWHLTLAWRKHMAAVVVSVLLWVQAVILALWLAFDA